MLANVSSLNVDTGNYKVVCALKHFSILFSIFSQLSFAPICEVIGALILRNWG